MYWIQIDLVTVFAVLNNLFLVEPKLVTNITCCRDKKPLKVAWEIGLRGILSHETIDYFTATQDFSSDILTRAQFFAQNGY